jgi:hypothetical protein
MLMTRMVTSVAVISLLFPQVEKKPVPINLGNPVTVCQVLENLEEYDNKIVEIRGEWSGNLTGNCLPLKSGAYVWPNVIQIELPRYAGGGALASPASWDPPEPSLHRFALIGAWKQWQALPEAQKSTTTVMATFVGRLDAGQPPLRLTRDGYPSGYGIQNIHPAQIVISELKDVKLEQVAKRVARPPEILP